MELTKEHYEELVAQYGKIYVCTVEGQDFAARSIKKSEMIQIQKLSEQRKDMEIVNLMANLLVFPAQSDLGTTFSDDGLLFQSVIAFLTESMKEAKVAVAKNF